MARKYNFYAGPATLPYSVLEQMQKNIVDYNGSGLSIMEASHRSPMYDQLHNETISLIRELMNVPDNYYILFLGGGATLQFGMVPMNLMKEGDVCDYIASGSWAQKAIKDANTYGDVRIAYDGSGSGFTGLPDPADVEVPEDSSYLHLTSNETIGGVQWKRFPKTPSGVPLVADMSSDILSRPIQAQDFGLIYAGAQKNIGPAGVCVVIIKDELVDRAPHDIPAYLRYKTHAEKNSLYNTPPVFAVYAMNLVMKWIREQGGMEGIENINRKKADTVYRAIERSGGFYSCPVDPTVRSVMNVVFRLPKEELEKRFIREAEERGMIGLKGHRSVGGCRASLYNAMPAEGAEQLAEFMEEFASKHG
jgi:phosphoserine aminotransferase